MKNYKKRFVFASLLIIIGILTFTGVMTVLKWDFSKLSTSKYETNNYKLSENFNNILISTTTADIEFVPSENGFSVECYEPEKAKHSVTADGNTLEIKVLDKRKWYEQIGINFGSPKITIHFPQGKYSNLKINNTTGNVKIPEGFTFCNADISLTTGDVSLLSSVTGTINCKSTTGDIKLSGISCATLTVKGSTGDVKMKDVIANEKITIRRTTGDVEFENCDAAELFIKVTTGHVKGSLLTEKTFEAKATTGKVDVPNTKSGGLCEIHTTTGHIKIDVK